MTQPVYRGSTIPGAILFQPRGNSGSPRNGLASALELRRGGGLVHRDPVLAALLAQTGELLRSRAPDRTVTPGPNTTKGSISTSFSTTVS